MSIRALFLLSAGALVLASCASNTPPKAGIGPPPSASFALVDSNADDYVDRAEWEAHGDKVFVTVDKDASGALTEAEPGESFAAFDADKDGVISPNELDLPELDKDGDGVISRNEWDGSVPFDRLDANRDGQISDDEFRASRAGNFTALDADVDERVSRIELTPSAPRFALFRF